MQTLKLIDNVEMGQDWITRRDPNKQMNIEVILNKLRVKYSQNHTYE